LDQATPDILYRAMQVTGSNPPSGRERLIVFTVLLIVAGAYAQAISYGFVADDASQILTNTRVHSFRAIPEYFTSHVWAQLPFAPGEHPSAYYRPLFLVWLLANFKLFGPDPLGWHIAAIAAHLLATLMVYFFVRALTKNAVISIITTLLFGLHPSHIETVAWVSGVTEPLVTIPLLGSLLCYMRLDDAGRGWTVGALLLYSIALLQKETAVMLPAILLAYDWLFVREARRENYVRGLATRITPYLVLTVPYLLARRWTLRDAAYTNVSLDTMILTWPSVLWFYLRHLIWPLHIGLFYDLGYATRLKDALLPALGVLAFAAALVFWGRNRPLVAFASLWLPLFILPPLNLRAFAAVEIVHDRYLYLPSIGFCLLIGLLLRRAFETPWVRVRLAAGFASVGSLTALYTSGTVLGSMPWSDEDSLFRYCRELAPLSLHAERQFASALGRTGNCSEAMPLLTDIIGRDPTDSHAIFALGACYFELGDFEEAEGYMVRTVVLKPHFQQPYLLIAAMRLQQNRVPEAEQALQKAVAVQIGSHEEKTFHLVKGAILEAKGDWAGAAREFRQELDFQPGNEQVLRELASVEHKLATTPASPGAVGSKVHP
jgi:tetratricopeptide (TPR) repeat protein